MRPNHLLFAAMLAGMSSATVAQVTLDIPDTVEVLVANGSAPKLQGGLFDAQKTLTLPDGENQILFRYKPYFQQGNERIIVESQPIVATFQATNRELSLDLPKYRNQQEAKQKLHSVKWRMLDSNQQPIELKYDQLVKEGMQIGRNYPQELADYNRTTGAAALAHTRIAAEQTSHNNQQDASTAEEMLHFWYNKADPETKARFKQYLLEQ